MTEPTLGWYINAFVEHLERDEPAALMRMRAVVGDRRARIGLDSETVEVQFVEGALEVSPPSGEPVDGTGAAGRDVVLALLDGTLDVTDAVEAGLIEVTGTPETIDAMFLAIEILIDSATRVAGLQDLASTFRATAGPFTRIAMSSIGRAAETDLLRRLGLLPGGH